MKRKNLKNNQIIKKKIYKKKFPASNSTLKKNNKKEKKQMEKWKKKLEKNQKKLYKKYK